MKLKTIIAALILAGFAQSALADECENLVHRDPTTTCEEIVKFSNERASEIIKEFTDAVRSVNDIAEDRYRVQTDLTNTADALIFLKRERDGLKQEIEYLKSQASSEKARVMIFALATAEIKWEYYDFIKYNQIPGISTSEVEGWKKAFSSNEGLHASGCRDMCYKITFDKKANENGFIMNLSPNSIAEDLLMRIKKIETQIDFSHRDFNIKQEIENIEYDLNALSHADIFDPDFFKREQNEYSPSAQYAIFIRDHINSILANPEMAEEARVGLLQAEKEKLDKENVTFEFLLETHQQKELSKKFDEIIY